MRCVVGLVVCGSALSLIIHAELGLAPWDVLHQGVSRRTGVPIGTVIVLFGLLVLLLWIPLRVRPGLGTLLNAVIIGVVVDVVTPRLPELEHLAARGVLLVAGIVLFGVGTGVYLGAGLGAGPRDGLMTGLVARGASVRVVRTGLELTVLLVGVALGGSIGIGTLLFTVGIGPIVHVALPRFSVGASGHGSAKPATATASSPAAGSEPNTKTNSSVSSTPRKSTT